jgi:hypothetical protein
MQPLLSVTIKLYEVVKLGLATGFETAASDKPVAGDH